MRRFVLAAPLFLASLPAAGQSSNTPACKDAALPFAASDANRLTGAALQQAITGKRLVYVRASARTPGLWVNGTREHRPDGSFVYVCAYGRSQEGPWRPCASFGSVEKRVSGARDIGVWSIRNDTVCAAKAAFGARSEDCFALHRQGAVFAAKRVSGPLGACMQGPITLQ